mmetsp:Transcript_9986/g.41924  ORF Transcript_9986/g.41924 Transcript_9986/m.41924 type:complete len:292 (-) Transcript_9986:1278-2153(-)
MAATMRRRAFAAPSLSLASSAFLCAFSASAKPAGSSASCRITESTASAIMSVSGSLDHSTSACATPVLPDAARLTIVSAPPFTDKPSGSGSPASAASSSAFTASSSAGSSFTASAFAFLPRLGDARVARAFGDAGGLPFDPSLSLSLCREVTVWIPSKSASSAKRRSVRGVSVGIICRCFTAAVASLVYSGKSPGATSMCPKSFRTRSPRTRSPAAGGFSASAPRTFAVFDPECLISTAWQFLGEYTCIFLPSAAALPSSARLSLPISPASPCTSTTCGGASASRNCCVCG